MRSFILFQIFMYTLAFNVYAKSVQVSQVRGMNFDYVVSQQGLITLDPIYCKDCAVVAIKGEPNTPYSVSCDFVDIVKNSSRIEILDCLLAHNEQRVTREVVTDIRGIAYLTIGSIINVKDKFSAGEYSGKIIINVRKNKKEEL